MIIDFPRKGINQAGKWSYCHLNRQTLATNITSADALWVRSPGDSMTLASRANGQTVPLLSLGVDAVDLRQHRAVNIISDSCINGIRIRLQAIGRKPNTLAQTPSKIFDEIAGARPIGFANQPARHQYRVSIYHSQEPRIRSTGVLRSELGSNVLFLGVAELPAFINLNPLALQIAEHAAPIVRTEAADFIDQPHDNLFCHTSHADSRAGAITPDQAGDHCGALLGSEAVHAVYYALSPTHKRSIRPRVQRIFRRLGALLPNES